MLKRKESMTYTEALNKFTEAIDTQIKQHYKEMKFSTQPDNVGINKGRRFDKITTDRSVYCFVEKDTGFIFKAATWRAPQLKTKNPVRGSIFETSTYEGKRLQGTGWLYQ